MPSVINLPSRIAFRNGLLVLVLLLLVWHTCVLNSVSSVKLAKWPLAIEQKCRPIPGLEDVLVVLRTGATESTSKLPIHFKTTLKCVPHYVVYSDYEEDIEGHRVMNSLDTVGEWYRINNPDFRLYNRLKQGGRQAINAQDLEQWSSVQNTAGGMLENPAWKLDKWKFLPLIEKLLQQRPQAKWFVFMEADTYILWSNLVEWLAQYDESEPHYLGNQQQIGDTLFGHGGSGFVISNPAMQLAAQNHALHRDNYEMLTAAHWAGDCALGKLMLDSGVPLEWTWPNLQSDPISSVNYTHDGYSKRMWCHRAVSYHHMTPEEIEAFWHFEQQHSKNGSAPFKHKDVFEQFVLPHLRSSRDDWDNLSEEHVDTDPSDSFDACKEVCLGKEGCLQFSVTKEGCRISSEVKLGRYSDDRLEVRSQSGWIVDRIEASVRDMEACGDEEWVL